MPRTHFPLSAHCSLFLQDVLLFLESYSSMKREILSVYLSLPRKTCLALQREFLRHIYTSAERQRVSCGEKVWGLFSSLLPLQKSFPTPVLSPLVHSLRRQ